MAISGLPCALLICHNDNKINRVDKIQRDDAVIDKLLRAYLQYVVPTSVMGKKAQITDAETEALITLFFAK